MKRIAVAVLFVVVGCRQKAEPPIDDGVESAGPAFRVEVKAPTSCVRGATCEARVELFALDGFKVNEEYPAKLIPDGDQQIASDFKHTSKTTAVLTMRFPAEGTAVHVSGTFKLSVCTKKVCKLESPKIAFDVPVT